MLNLKAATMLTNLLPLKNKKTWVDFGSWDGLPVHRQSPIRL